jgi:hypothetical protein
MRVLGVAAALTAILGCSTENTCIEGQSVACACINGKAGAQVCASGKFEQCVCDEGFDMSVGGDLAGADLLGVDLLGLDLTGQANDAASAPKRLFVTSLKYKGDLKTAGLIATNGGPITTGLEGGDGLCQTAAMTAGLGGTWKAYLSDSTTNAYDRIADVGPWTLVGGAILFANKAALKGAPAGPINRDETGKYIPDISAVTWTGTNVDGTKATNNCTDWTSSLSSPSAQLGCQYVNTWSSCGGSICDNSYALYCFEQ